MTDDRTKRYQYTAGPIAAVVTVPGEFLSAAIFEAVQGAWRLGGAIGRAAGKLSRR